MTELPNSSTNSSCRIFIQTFRHFVFRSEKTLTVFGATLIELLVEYAWSNSAPGSVNAQIGNCVNSIVCAVR